MVPIEKTQSPTPPAPAAPRPGFWRSVLALLAPRRFGESLVQADHDSELSRDAAITRLERLRGVLAKSLVSMASAVIVGIAFREFYAGPMLPRTVFAVGSLFLFASATLGRLGWAGQSWKGDTSVERLDQRIFHALYWIGMLWGTLALL